MAINYASQFAPKVVETFAQESLTDSAAGQDFQFTGSKSIKVLAVDTVPLNDYQREGANRYGTPVELGDVVQELVMKDDKSFTMTIDKGNSADQMNLKGAAEAMKRQVAQVVVPYIDKYRLKVWARSAGVALAYDDEADFAGQVLEAIFDAGAAMDNSGVPQGGRTLFLPNRFYKQLALTDKLIGVDKLGEAALTQGIVGQIDGMTVKRIPDNYLPVGILFLVKHRNSSVDPVKLQEGKIHKDPPGLSGNLLEGRIYQDAFVLHSKCDGIGIAGIKSVVPPANKISYEPGGKVTLEANSSVSQRHRYTTDGSDPRYSPTAKEYTGSFQVSNGTVVRAVCIYPIHGYYSSVSERPIIW